MRPAGDVEWSLPDGLDLDQPHQVWLIVHAVLQALDPILGESTPFVGPPYIGWDILKRSAITIAGKLHIGGQLSRFACRYIHAYRAKG